MGVDIAVEALGKPQTFLQCVQSVKDGGKAVMIGLAQSGAVGEVDINRLVRRKVYILLSLSNLIESTVYILISLSHSYYLVSVFPSPSMGIKIHLNSRKKNIEKLKDRIKLNVLNKADLFNEPLY